MKPVLLCVLLYISVLIPVYSQESTVQAAAQTFFTAFIADDSVLLDQQFISKDAFWKFLNDSYLIGQLNDTLTTKSEHTRLKLLALWKEDLKVCRTKASELYKIRWESILNTTYSIEYQERSNAGFMFRSYRVTIHFIYKKKAYSMLLDGFVVIDGKAYILANQCTLTR